MPVESKTLDAIARRYVQTMTSIRGRRVHRLLMREFARFDHVLPATVEDGSAALLALTEGGAAAVCRTDGRGAAADIVESARWMDATVTTSCDLLKDSLPILRWTIWHPGFALTVGVLTIARADLADADFNPVTDILRRAGG
ncbi:MAG TPA: hypothetical protein VGC55_03580 [Dokdonella sp.]